MDDQLTLLFGQLDFPSKKHAKKLTFQTFAPKKCQGDFVLGEFTQHLGGGGKLVFGVTWVHPSKRPGEDASTLSWQLSWRPRLQPLPSCHTIANVLAVREASGCFGETVGIWGHRFFLGFKKNLRSQSASS